MFITVSYSGSLEATRFISDCMAWQFSVAEISIFAACTTEKTIALSEETLLTQSFAKAYIFSHDDSVKWYEFLSDHFLYFFAKAFMVSLEIMSQWENSNTKSTHFSWPSDSLEGDVNSLLIPGKVRSSNEIRLLFIMVFSFIDCWYCLFISFKDFLKSSWGVYSFRSSQ